MLYHTGQINQCLKTTWRYNAHWKYQMNQNIFLCCEIFWLQKYIEVQFLCAVLKGFCCLLEIILSRRQFCHSINDLFPSFIKLQCTLKISNESKHILVFGFHFCYPCEWNNFWKYIFSNEWKVCVSLFQYVSSG
jgi:hypothetical protein